MSFLRQSIVGLWEYVANETQFVVGNSQANDRNERYELEHPSQRRRWPWTVHADFLRSHALPISVLLLYECTFHLRSRDRPRDVADNGFALVKYLSLASLLFGSFVHHSATYPYDGHGCRDATCELTPTTGHRGSNDRAATVTTGNGDRHGRLAVSVRQNQDDVLLRSLVQNNTGVVHSTSAQSDVSSGKRNDDAPATYCEVMVHNVSHTDLILSLRPPDDGNARNDTQAVRISDNNNNNNNEQDDVDGDYVEIPGNDYCLCRPRFSAFSAYSRRVLQALKAAEQQRGAKQPSSSSSATALTDMLIRFPCYGRSEYTPRYDIQPNPSPHMEQLPIGFQLHLSEQERRTSNVHPLIVTDKDLTDLRIRGRDAPRVCPDPSALPSQLELNAVFFPLLATLLPRWHQRMAVKYPFLSNATATAASSSASNAASNMDASKEKRGPRVKKVLVLVTGVGTPRNWTHSINGNSTRLCAQLCKRFIHTIYPDVTVVTIHSETNVFRYDENITFVQRQLLPAIQAYRDAHAQKLPYPDEVVRVNGRGTGTTISSKDILHQSNRRVFADFSTEWNKTFTVTISFADGSPARNHAIQAALRPFRPSYFHFWQLKTFWHSSQIVLDDLEVHSFEEMNTTPALEASKLQDPLLQSVTQEILQFQREITELLQQEEKSDLLKFWLRKTHKPVLAVLAVQMPGWKQCQLYRGTNMEVSMPTGSLCAERNVIGTALANNPSLRRQDLRCIAVLAVPLPRPITLVPPAVSTPHSQTDDDTLSVNTSCVALQNAQMSRTNSIASAHEVSEQDVQITSTTAPGNAGTVQRSVVQRRGRQDSISEYSATTEGPDDDWILHPLEKSPINASLTTSQGSQAPPASSLSSVPTDKAAGVNTMESSFSKSTRSSQGEVGTHPGVSDTLSSDAPARQIALYEETSKAVSGSMARKTSSTGSRVLIPPKNPANLVSISRRKTKRMVVVHSEHDINPLKPCGACNEWLKKIAESNPYFRILTFTDKDCNGVYCKPCEE